MGELDISKLDLTKDNFAVVAEKDGYNTPALLFDLTFGRLLDEVVVPYEGDKDFFVDGIPFNRKNIKRLKIVMITDFGKSSFNDLFYHVRRPNKTISSAEYYLRLDAILRESGIDITSQVISVYQRTIKDKIKDWLPKREELISGAWSVFKEALTVLITTKLK